MEQPRPTWYEFFAGGGMTRLGLGEGWQCLFSNEWCPKKASAYRARHGAEELLICDVADLTPDDLPVVPTLVWASFPCQDLSLAGNGAGLEGGRSGTFKPFWELMRGMVGCGRHPQLIVLENVVGTLTSHEGKDFALIVGALAKEGYQVGALVMDAVRFLPQSRPRLFIVGVHSTTAVRRLNAKGKLERMRPIPIFASVFGIVGTSRPFPVSRKLQSGISCHRRRSTNCNAILDSVVRAEGAENG
jgi:DNA (cytosine-5)-methyltransferase 1